MLVYWSLIARNQWLCWSHTSPYSTPHSLGVCVCSAQLWLHTPFLLVYALVWNSLWVIIGLPTLSSISHAITHHSGLSVSLHGNQCLHHALRHVSPFLLQVTPRDCLITFSPIPWCHLGKLPPPLSVDLFWSLGLVQHTQTFTFLLPARHSLLCSIHCHFVYYSHVYGTLTKYHLFRCRCLPCANGWAPWLVSNYN